MSLESQARMGSSIIAIILCVVAGVSFLGIQSNDATSAALYHGLAWLSFGMVAVSVRLMVPPSRSS